MTGLKEGKKKNQYELNNKKKKKKKSIANIFVKSLAIKGIYVKSFK